MNAKKGVTVDSVPHDVVVTGASRVESRGRVSMG